MLMLMEAAVVQTDSQLQTLKLPVLPLVNDQIVHDISYCDSAVTHSYCQTIYTAEPY